MEPELAVQRRLGKIEQLERAEETGLGLRVFVGKRQAIVSSTERPVPLHYSYVTTPIHETLEELLGFLYAECCTRNKAVEPKRIVAVCK